MSESPTVTEIEFRFEGDELALGRAAAAAGVELEYELMVPRSDGTVLAFVAMSGGVTTVLDRLADEPNVREATPLDRAGTGSLLQLITDGHPVTTFADRGAVVTQISFDPHWGRVVADVPAPVEINPIIAAFTLAHPSARLVGRRETDRETPQLGQSQFVTRVLTRFTPRQLDVLRTAYLHGYFEWPREHKAAEIADELDVSTPTFSQHIRAAEGKLTELLFEG